MADARLTHLRSLAVNRTLFPATTLAHAIERLGFVQADPIRSPARAQDLILRHRVVGYRAGDLERQYASLEVEEDCLYAYGFVSKPVWQLLHPRKTAPLSAFEKKVLQTVVRLREAHPRVLEAHLGNRRVVNAWGGYSKATTNALERLHWRGLLRIARRERGIRVYCPVSLAQAVPDAAQRLRALIMVYARVFAPSPDRSLRAVIGRHGDLGNPRNALEALITEGALRRDVYEGVTYISPADEISAESPNQVRFLAPFDPLVWDRARFEQLWGWAYRFEAYTPVKQRVRGYYAMPLLWRTAIVGWANATLSAGSGKLDIDLGFVSTRPRAAEFRRELDAEIARFAAFLR